MTEVFDLTEACAQRLDDQDPMASFRHEFVLPITPEGETETYLVGNSLGIPPAQTGAYLQAEFAKWGKMGVRGHEVTDQEPDYPWASYQESLAGPMAELVGAKPEEVTVMNSLTTNLHLLMVSFYQPTAERFKILIEGHAFPSDHFAVESQIRQRGFDPTGALVTVDPRPGEDCLREEDIAAAIEQHGDQLALVLFPGVQYYTGQVFDMASIATQGHAVGAMVGFDLAHAVGNIEFELHDWDADFAAWCTYKYLNSGAGATAGCFVHQRHITRTDLPRFEGWWGTNKATRFEMENVFDPIPTVEGWQTSNPPVFAMAPIRSSLEVFTRAGGMGPLREKTEKQIAYLDFLLAQELPAEIQNITPQDLAQRGCQFSLRVMPGHRPGREVFEALEAAGVACDWRYPDVIRIAPVPLYNTFLDIYRFVQILKEMLQ